MSENMRSPAFSSATGNSLCTKENTTISRYETLSADPLSTRKKKRLSFDHSGGAPGTATDKRDYIRSFQVFIQHTSASLTINENADPTVRKDFEMFFNKTVKENDLDYIHDYEGSDDMPAHLKASLLGNSVLIPILNGRL